MAGQGNKGNLGRARGAARVVSELAPGPVWEPPGAGASLHAAHSGKHKAPFQERAASGRPPAGPGHPRVSGRAGDGRTAAEGRGAGEPGGAGRGGWGDDRARAREAVAAEEGSAGGWVGGRAGGATSPLL